MAYTRASFDIANAYGQQGELWVMDVIEHLRTGAGAIEVKHKSYRDAQFYVELEAWRYGGWGPSGLNVSTASIWVFVIAESGCAAIFPAQQLKRAVNNVTADPRRQLFTIKSATQPTRGYVLSWVEILDAA